jgi:hypothetical protein
MKENTMKMLQLKLDDAKVIFCAIADVSPCHDAALMKGVCMSCGQPIAMPFYFITKANVPDQFYIDKERGLRGKLPVGTELVLCVPHMTI